MLPLEKIKNFRQQQARVPMGNMLQDTNEVMVPIMAGSTAFTAVTMVEKKGEWQVASVGKSVITKTEPARQKLTAGKKEADREYFVVKVPAMHLIFLGYYEGGELYLVPTHIHPDVKFPLHQPLLAADVFTRLSPLAATYENALVPPKEKK